MKNVHAENKGRWCSLRNIFEGVIDLSYDRNPVLEKSRR